MWFISICMNLWAVWTEINFFPLLTCPKGSQGCQKMHQHPLNSNLEVWYTKIQPKFNNHQKTCQNWKISIKKPCLLAVFWRLFNFGSILEHQSSKFKFSGCCCIFWHPLDPWWRVNSGDTRVLRFVMIFFTFMKMLFNVNFISHTSSTEIFSENFKLKARFKFHWKQKWQKL